MKIEILGGKTYKITLSRAECSELPPFDHIPLMSDFLIELFASLDAEHGITIPDGRLLVEAFAKSDGSCMLFISELCARPASHADRLYACEIFGAGTLMALIAALKGVKSECSVYRGSALESYRVILTDPSREARLICAEFSECCEITPLFAAQTDEYLTLIARGSADALTEQ